MGDTKFTPGPWKICYDGQIDGSNGRFICGLRFSSFKEFNEDEELKANARLIAAAPELYEALKELLIWYKDATSETEPRNYDVVEKAEAALSRATDNTVK